MKKIVLQINAVMTRFICWVSYGIGCYRNITSTLEIYKNYTIADLKKELDVLISICDCTGLDCDYLKKLVSIRLSSGILRLLQIYGGKNLDITSDPERLKILIESLLEVTIESTEYGYRYNNKPSFPSWGIDCDNTNKRRFELYSIVLSKIGD